MSVRISGVLKDGAGIPVQGCIIELRAKKTSPTVVVDIVATCITGSDGGYTIDAEPGFYDVFLQRSGRAPTKAGEIYVTPTDEPGTLNTFLDAPKSGDLRPEVMQRFEAMVNDVIRLSEQVGNDSDKASTAAETATNAAVSALESQEQAEAFRNEAQQSAEAAAESERQAGQYVADAQKIKEDCQALTDNVQQNADAVAEDKKQVALLASSATQDAARAEQAKEDAGRIVDKALDKLGETATLTGEARASAEAAAKSEQSAKGHADNAAGSAQQTAQDVETTTTARDDAERFANGAENSARVSGTARDESVEAAERARQHKEAASSAATRSEQSADIAQGHENSAAGYALQAKASQDASADNAQEAKQHKDEAQRIVDDLNATNATTTEKGLVQLCSDTDNDSEELAATPKAVKAVMDETKTKAPLDSPAFTGTPTTPTPADDATGMEIANAKFVRKLLAALVGSSPEALDTLNELAAALGNDPEFAATMTNALAGKQPLSDVLTAISELTQRADNLLCFNQDGNASLSPLSEKARTLLTLDTPEAMRQALELSASATMEPQSDIRDRTPGRLAQPGAFGYGMTEHDGTVLGITNLDELALICMNAAPGRYYTSSMSSGDLTGVAEFIWLDNWQNDKTSQTATKLILFYGRDGRILFSVRGDEASAPVTWTNLTSQSDSAAPQNAQENVYDRTEGRLAIPGMFGFGKIFSPDEVLKFSTEAEFLRWVKTAMPGRYTVYAATGAVIQGVLFSGTVEIIWLEPQSSAGSAYTVKGIIFHGINGHIYYNRYWTTSGGNLSSTGWTNLKVDEASLRALIEARAPLNSPAFTGTPTTPTPPDDAAGNEIASAAFVRKLLAALVDSSPEALDTLNELAAALGNDPEFATTVTNALAGKQPLNDILTSLSGLATAGNKLPYFSDKNVMALANLTAVGRMLIGQDSKSEVLGYLGLKSAATMEPQDDIRDRTEGRLALSGMHGFGQAFTTTDALAFNGQADFVPWLQNVTPGRYAVSIADSSSLLAGTSKFNGIIDVMWSPFDNDESDATRKFKTLLFYNQYYEGEHSIHRLTYRWSGNNWNASVSPVIYDGDSLGFLLSRTAGTDASSYYKYPAVGVPIFAVYRGLHLNDNDKKIAQGDVVQGSRLSPLAILCSAGDTGIFTGNPRFLVGTPGSCAGFPGRYMALSGQNATTTLGQYGYACLFVRIE